MVVMAAVTARIIQNVVPVQPAAVFGLRLTLRIVRSPTYFWRVETETPPRTDSLSFDYEKKPAASPFSPRGEGHVQGCPKPPKRKSLISGGRHPLGSRLYLLCGNGIIR
jgi:hypothetical protein